MLHVNAALSVLLCWQVHKHSQIVLLSSTSLPVMCITAPTPQTTSSAWRWVFQCSSNRSKATGTLQRSAATAVCPTRGQKCKNFMKQNHFAKMSHSSTYYKFCSHLPLEQLVTALCGYDNSRIDILGVLHVPVHYGSKNLPSVTFPIARKGANLLGLACLLAWGSCLGMMLAPTSPHHLHLVSKVASTV